MEKLEYIRMIVNAIIEISVLSDDERFFLQSENSEDGEHFDRARNGKF